MAGRASKLWLQHEAIDFAAHVENYAEDYGAHIALTGGCLYKSGPRKDLDLVVYRIRQVVDIDRVGFFERLERCISGFVLVTRKPHFCMKAMLNGKEIDFLFPETENGGDYEKDEDDA
jgi:hypothetical protein